MKRREFMVAASGVSGGAVAATAATPVVAQEEEDGNDTETGDGGDGNDTEAGGGGNESSGDGGNESAGGGGGGGGGTETVEVDDNEFVPAELTIEPGTTVTWEWVGSNQHNINPGSQPEDANWEGQTDLQAEGTYEHTFETEGTYEYVCDPHVSVGMTGSIEVTSDAGGGGPATADVDIHELGVPIQKHFVGVASFFAIFIALTFTFYLLKYGESANTSSPGRK